MTEHGWQVAEALHEQRDRLRATLSSINDIEYTARQWRANPFQDDSMMTRCCIEITDTCSLRKRGVVMPLDS